MRTISVGCPLQTHNSAKPIAREGIPRGKFAEVAATAGYLLLASIMLSWVALFNGAPLVFSDTLSYSTAAYEGKIPGLFSIFYSAFILPLHQGVTFWPVVFIQAAILAQLLYLAARAVTRGKISYIDMTVIVFALAVFSSLPWITGEVLPDVFTPIVLLGLFLLSFAEKELNRAELIYVAILTTFAISTHLSHIPIAAGLIVLCFGLRIFVARQRNQIWAWTARLVLPLVIAVASMIAVNVVSSQSFVLARNSNVFLLAKWIDEGPALAYLRESCPEAGYALCEYLGELEGKSHDERVRIVARLRDREGYAAEAVLDREGRPRGVVERHCPIQSMAERWPEICRLEEDLIRRALGEGVQREEHLLSGSRCCKYRVDVV